MDPRRSFSMLDLPMDASLEQARQAYRDLMSVWHPDRHTHSPRLQQKAEDKVKEINAAYEAVRAFLAHRPPDGPAPEASASPKKKSGNKRAPAHGERQHLRGKKGKTDWRRTEAILSSLKRAGEKAAAREKSRVEAEARARRRAEAEQAKKKRAAAEQTRKKAIQQQRREKQRAMAAERAKTKNWEITEARLQRILNSKKTESPATGSDAPQPRPEGMPARSLLIQWIGYTLALIPCFSVNIVQDRYRFGAFTVLGLCIAAVATCRLVLARMKNR
jgi:curved DNA-binding protein CbpA